MTPEDYSAVAAVGERDTNAADWLAGQRRPPFPRASCGCPPAPWAGREMAQLSLFPIDRQTTITRVRRHPGSARRIAENGAVVPSTDPPNPMSEQ